MVLSFCANPSIDCFAWLNQIDEGKVNRVTELKEFPGGKGVHVALAIAELGETVGLFGCWAGVTGKKIRNAIYKKNIKISGIDLEGENRRCYTFRSTNYQFNNTEILEPGPDLSLINWEVLKDAFENEILEAEFVCLSGSWPKNAPRDAYLQLIRIVQKQKKKVFLDCSGLQLKEALKTSFFGLHLNENEAFEFCGSKSMEVLLKKLGNKVELVALTRGKNGLLMSYKNEIISANVRIDKAFSTVGSGDCLTAGIIWALNNSLNSEEIATYGVACGAANCLNEDLGILRKEDVNDLLPKVRCKTIENEL